ncbi:MAG: M14/M99 family metallopeptidase [bacterium]
MIQLILLITLIFSNFLFSEPVGQEHKIYFKKTDYELHVFKIHGKEPGPTLMIIGGIQGDEPGSYISADMYADARLKKGNLIVIPRANFLSIIAHKRQINKDMNRLFDNTGKETQEDKVVAVLKELIKSSDFLLNLHEGSGFYNPKYIDELNNPKEFGQSIIADTDSYKSPKCNCELRLKDMADKVTKEVNQKIDNPSYKFRFNNHNTASDKTTHPEQKGSATYYALYTVGIPAFGIETSKNIEDIELKVNMHTMIINEFMKQLDIVPEDNYINVMPPILKYMLVKVNGVYKLVLKGETIYIPKKSRLEIKIVETNYPRGVTADLVGYGSYNDIGKSIIVNKNTKIVLKKDSQLITEIPVKIKGGENKQL